MHKIVIDILMYFSEAVFFLYYASSLYAGKRSFPVRAGAAALIHVVLFAVYQRQIVLLNALLFLALYVAAFCFLYDISLKTAAFQSTLFVLVMFASELAVMGVGTLFFRDFNAMDNDPFAYVYVIVTSKLLFYSLMLAVMKLFALKDKGRPRDRQFWLLLIMPFSGLVMMLLFRYMAYTAPFTGVTNLLVTVASVTLLFANVAVFVIYERAVKNVKELYELRAARYKQTLDRQYYEMIDRANMDMRVFSHDVKHHLSQLREMDDADAIHAYIDALHLDIRRFDAVGVSKNKMLDLVLSKYLCLCEAEGVRFSVDVKTANLYYIDDTDLTTLMGNLLDNALEAAREAPDPFIDFVVFSKNALFDGLIIRNRSKTPPIASDGRLRTRKSRKELHGLGLFSVQKAVKKYGGVFDWDYDAAAAVFRVSIAFPKPEKPS